MITQRRLVEFGASRQGRASKNCYTCRERKIGCDRALPSWRNCQRSNRLCKGYGIKLAWPDTSKDGRRKNPNFEVANISHNTSGYVYLQDGLPFINTSMSDVADQPMVLRGHLKPYALLNSPSLGVLSGFDESTLLSYYEGMLSRMITTIDDAENGFRSTILPLALSSKDPSSQSLLQATLSLSALHLGRPNEALKYRTLAMKTLSESLQPCLDPFTICSQAQLATCMMLCVNGVFDASDNSWSLHLRGARSLIQQIGITRTASSQISFLLDWFAYHDVLQDYTTHYAQNDQSGDGSSDNVDSHVIIGSLGCSREVLQCISQINKLRDSSPQQSSDRADEAEKLRRRLQDLEQVAHINSGQISGLLDMTRITLTAEFYRKAALLYLEQVIPLTKNHESYTESLMEECFAILEQLGLCTSPWPLFILASWCTRDEHRVKILATLEAMHVKRRIQNVEIIESIIRALWSRMDLNANDKAYQNMDWRDLVDIKECMPSFI